MRVSNYEDDSKHNTHILKLWAKMLHERFPSIHEIRIYPGRPSGEILVSVINWDDKTKADVDVYHIQIHTESFKNYQRYKSKGRIAIQHYKKEQLQIHGDSSVFATKADLYFHGFRNQDPADQATEILEPMFFWTGKLRRYVKQLQLHDSINKTGNFDIKPFYTLNWKRYDGFRISSWTPFTRAERDRGEVDPKWILNNKEKIWTIGILLPVKDVRDCMTENPFAPSLMSYGV
jgi:hypothetical protein